MPKEQCRSAIECITFEASLLIHSTDSMEHCASSIGTRRYLSSNSRELWKKSLLVLSAKLSMKDAS